MKKFTCVQDIGDLKSALAEAFEIKKERFKYVDWDETDFNDDLLSTLVYVPASAHRKLPSIWE